MRQKNPLEKKIEEAVTATAESMGFELVEIMLHGQGRQTLDIMADKLDGTRITLDECGKLSQAISAIMDVENIMGDKGYYLEVGSPGIDRPLTKLNHFERFKGQNARIEIEPAIENRKRFKGTLQGVEQDTVLIEMEGELFRIPSSSIEYAKLQIVNTMTGNEKKGSKGK